MLLQLHVFVLLLSLASAIKVIELNNQYKEAESFKVNPRLIGSSGKLKIYTTQHISNIVYRIIISTIKYL